MRRRITIFAAIVLVLVAGGGLYAWYWADLAAADRRISSGSAIANTSAGPIEYADTMIGQPFLVIHGSGGGFDQGLLIAERILPAGFRVIAPSRFGYLRTPLPNDASAAQQAEAHAALLDTLGIKRTVVAGISAGTPSAFAFARAHPERTAALILISPAIFSAERPSMEPTPGNRLLLGIVMRGSDFFFWLLKRFAYSRVVRFMGVEPSLYHSGTEGERAEIDRVIDAVMPLERRLSGMVNDGAVIGATGQYRLDDLSVPVLLICARDDLLADCNEAERMGRSGNRTEVAVFHDGGHLLLGRWTEAREAMSRFLSRIGVGAYRDQDCGPFPAPQRRDDHDLRRAMSCRISS